MITQSLTMPNPLDIPLPRPRGPLSAWVLDRLVGTSERPAPHPGTDGFSDDLQLALYLANEGHFSSLPGVDAAMEWDPSVIGFRGALERVFERSLVDAVGPVSANRPIEDALPALIDADTGPSLSRYMESYGTIDEMRDFVVHRSLYQLKEGDAHTLGISRLSGRAKQLLAAIQAGEYGADEPGREIHSVLFAQTMRELDLDPRPHAYLGTVPATAMAVSNLISLFGLHRRFTGALVGHLAVFEMTSVVPMGRYARGLDRLGASAAARRFYDVHVLADAEHENMALQMAVEFVKTEPDRAREVIFGARCVLEIERRFASRLLASWALRHRAA